MRLAHLYILAKTIKKDTEAYRPDIEITYHLTPTEHSDLQKETYIMIHNNLTGYKELSEFELSLIDIKFTFKK